MGRKIIPKLAWKRNKLIKAMNENDYNAYGIVTKREEEVIKKSFYYL